MACGMVLGRFPFSIWVSSVQEQWMPLGKRVVLAGGKSLDYALTINVLTSTAAAIPATALMTARPDVIAAVNAASGTFTNTVTTTHHATDLSAVTDRFLGQPGVLGKLASGSIAGYVSGFLSIVFRSCGTLIGTRELMVEPSQTTGAPRMYLLGRVPASGADKLRAALISNAMNDVDYQFFVRGVNDPDAPGAWVAVGTWATFANGASAVCTTDASVAGVGPSGYHLLEFALALRLKSTGASPAGFVRVSAALSYT